MNQTPVLFTEITLILSPWIATCIFFVATARIFSVIQLSPAGLVWNNASVRSDTWQLMFPAGAWHRDRMWRLTVCPPQDPWKEFQSPETKPEGSECSAIGQFLTETLFSFFLLVCVTEKVLSRLDSDHVPSAAAFVGSFSPGYLVSPGSVMVSAWLCHRRMSSFHSQLFCSEWNVLTTCHLFFFLIACRVIFSLCQRLPQSGQNLRKSLRTAVMSPL